MGYVLHVLLGLLPLALTEYAARDASVVGVALLALVPIAAGWGARRALARRRLALAARLHALVRGSPPVLAALAILGLGWCGALEAWLGRDVSLASWPTLWTALGLVPLLLYEALAIDAHARTVEPRPAARASARRLQLRLLATAFLPFVLFLGFSTLLGLRESWRVHVEEVGLLSLASTAVLLVLLLGTLPWIMRRTLDTVPLEAGGLRALLDGLARGVGFRLQGLYRWRTGGRMANAAVVGFTPRTRLVLLSDALLARLGPLEIAAVFAHEMGHARRRHALALAVLVLALFLLANLTVRELGGVAELGQLGELGVLLAYLLVGWLVLGWLSRRFELDADLEGLHTLGDARPMILALEQVTAAHARSRGSWRHPSTASRVEFLLRAAGDPRIGRGLRAGLRRAVLAIWMVFVIAGAYEATELVRALPLERTHAALRLGDYAAAARHLTQVEEGEQRDELVRLARAGITLGGGRSTPQSLLDAAREALRAGRPEEALVSLELASYRGMSGLDDAHEALRSGLARGASATYWRGLEPLLETLAP